MTDDAASYRTQLLLLDFLSLWDETQQTMSEPAFDLLVQEVMEAGAVAYSMLVAQERGESPAETAAPTTPSPAPAPTPVSVEVAAAASAPSA